MPRSKPVRLLASSRRFQTQAVGVLAAIAIMVGIYIVVSSHASNLPGDADGNNVVNAADLSILSANWGKTSASFSQGDFDGNGVVNAADLSILAANWGTTSTGGGSTAGNCPGLTDGTAAFCDNFNAPAGTGNRSGDLNGTVWGVSRATGNTPNDQYNSWAPAPIQKCDGSTPTVSPPNDVIICNGQLREAVNDNVSGNFEAGTVTVLAMYPKQPFDFAGRTGKVVFDVSNDSHGSHAAWPEFWLTDTPVPAPLAHFNSWYSLPQNGIGLRLDGYVDNNGNANSCPEGTTNFNNDNLSGPSYSGLGGAILIKNYVEDDTDNPDGHTLKITGSDCVKQSTQLNQLNHYEIDISQNQIDVYGTDAFTGALNLANTPLKHLATISNANLGLTRGLVWMEDAHYNADKADPNNPAMTQARHTFVWDNVGFDGPLTYRDLSFDALDNNQAAPDGGINLGKFSTANSSASWTTLPLPSNPTATAVRVMFNFHSQNATSFNISINGHAHTVAWPYPADPVPSIFPISWRTFQTVIPITDLVAGANTVTIGSDQNMITTNVNIVLVDATTVPNTPID